MISLLVDWAVEIGFVALVVSTFTAAYIISHRRLRSFSISPWSIPVHIAGLFLAIWSLRLEYTAAEGFRILGIPFPVAFFVRIPESDLWRDYFSGLSPQIAALNFMIWYLLPWSLVASCVASISTIITFKRGQKQ